MIEDTCSPPALLLTGSPPPSPLPCSRQRQRDPIITLWMLRLLVPLQGHEEWISERAYQRDGIAAALCLSLPLSRQGDPPPQDTLLRQLQNKYERAERYLTRWHRAGTLQRSLQHIQQLLSLNTVEVQILEFVVCLHLQDVLREAADLLGDLVPHRLTKSLARVLQIAERDVQHALRPQGQLNQSGLLRFQCSVGTLYEQLELISTEFAQAMAQGEVEAQKVLRGMVTLGPQPHLTWSDYAHLQPSLLALRPYLLHCAQTRPTGANILLYGPPGTGKTQLARLLAQLCQCALYEVATQNCDGDPIVGVARIRAYRIAQAMLGSTQGLLLFDEVDDVFLDSDFDSKRLDGQIQKPWLNHALEHNPIPTLWVCNRIEGMDPAYVRRFDMVLEVPIPPQSVRLSMAKKHCGDWVPDSVAERLATSPHLAPAVLERASRVERMVHAQHALMTPEKQSLHVTAKWIDEAIEVDRAHEAHAHDSEISARSALLLRLVNHTLRAQGHRTVRLDDPQQLPEVYDPHFVHADLDLHQLAQGIRHTRNARLCLFGPPGTGKTAYARWLAQQLDMPLLALRASDLISKYVGETESNLSAAFAQAQDSASVLLIDEVDGFLQDRSMAQRTWEVTAVNEMLTQMECFSGVFIATTNALDALDQAALRRFDLKAHFDYLQPKQAWQLLLRCSEQMQLDMPKSSEALHMLEMQWSRSLSLTPGDFASVMRRHRFNPLHSLGDMVNALQAEVALKNRGAGLAMGFV